MVAVAMKHPNVVVPREWTIVKLMMNLVVLHVNTIERHREPRSADSAMFIVIHSAMCM